MTGKSRWVPSHTQGLFSTCCRWYYIPWVLQELLLSRHGRGVRPWARLFYVVLPMMLLLDLITNWHVFKQVCVMMVLKLYCFRYYIWTWVVITLFVLRGMLNYLWTYVTCGLYVESCTILVVCWIIRDSSWCSTDYWVYMGSNMTVQPLWWLSLYLCSYKLVGSTIAGNGVRFNIICHMCI